MVTYDIRKGVKKIKTKTALAISGAALGTAGLLMAVMMPLAAHAVGPNSYTLFGDAQYVSPGNASARAVQTRSAPTAPGYGGIDYSVQSGMTIAQLNNLATDYNFTAGSCGGGSPRFQVNTTGGSIFVYIGPPPNYTGCPPNTWLNSGNLTTPASLVDASQIGGTFYEPWSVVQATYGSLPVTGIQLVTDAGWVFGTQTAVFDNTQINTNLYTYEVPQPQSKDDCKNGGWMNLARADGSTFKNQGDCVSYTNTGR